MRLASALALAALGALVPSRPVRAEPDARGPYAFDVFDAGDVDAAGTGIPTVVYYPTTTTAPVPVVAVVHGFLRNGSFMAELARTLASHGLVAVVPDMPCGARGCDHDANGRQISALLDWAEAASADPASPLAGKVDGARRGALGHSWGGLGVFVAASQDPRFSSVLMLDPNDDRGLAASLAPSMGHATAHVMAERFGSCNATEWTTTVFPLTPGPHLRVRVVGSGHCDVEDPSDGLCPLACGSGDAATTPMFRRYAVAWTLCNLTRDPAMADWIGGGRLDDDIAGGRIDQVDALGLDALPCRGGTAADAGVRDAATTDSAVPRGADARVDAAVEVPRDAGAASPDLDAAMSLDAEGSGASEESTSCACAPRPRGHTSFLPVLIVAALAACARPRHADAKRAESRTRA